MTTTGQQHEALVFANDRPSSIGDDLYQWSVDAEAVIRAQAARIAELEAQLDATQPAAQGLDAQEEWVPQPEKVNRYCGCPMCLETDVEHEPSCRRHPSQAKQGGA